MITINLDDDGTVVSVLRNGENININPEEAIIPKDLPAGLTGTTIQVWSRSSDEQIVFLCYQCAPRVTCCSFIGPTEAPAERR